MENTPQLPCTKSEQELHAHKFCRREDGEGTVKTVVTLQDDRQEHNLKATKYITSHSLRKTPDKAISCALAVSPSLAYGYRTDNPKECKTLQ